MHQSRKLCRNLLSWLFIDKDGKRVRYPIDAEMQIGFNYNDLVSYDPLNISRYKLMIVRNFGNLLRDFQIMKLLTLVKLEIIRQNMF